MAIRKAHMRVFPVALGLCLPRMIPYIMIAFLCTTFAGAQDEEFSFRVDVTSPCVKLLVREPLVFDVGISNVNTRPVEVREALRVGEGRLSLHITRQGGETWEYGSPGHGDGDYRMVTIGPGTEHVFRQVVMESVLRGPRGTRIGYAFPQAGEYEAVASFAPHSRGPNFRSKGLLVSVAEPRARELEALGVFKGDMQARCISGCLAGAWGGEPQEELQLLADRYPDTVYGRYARFYFARRMLHPDDGARRGGHVQAIPKLEKLLDEDSKSAIAEQCMFYLADCYEHAARKADAAGMLTKLLQAFPDGSLARRAKSKLGGMR